LAQLRAASTRDLYEAYVDSRRFGFPPVIDGYFFTKSMLATFEAKEQAQVPLLVGWNSAEIPGMAFTQGPITEDILISKVKEAYPNDWEEALKVYPHGNAKELEWAATNLASDRFITWHPIDLFPTAHGNGSIPIAKIVHNRFIVISIANFARHWLIKTLLRGWPVVHNKAA